MPQGSLFKPSWRTIIRWTLSLTLAFGLLFSAPGVWAQSVDATSSTGTIGLKLVGGFFHSDSVQLAVTMQAGPMLQAIDRSFTYTPRYLRRRARLVALPTTFQGPLSPVASNPSAQALPGAPTSPTEQKVALGVGGKAGRLNVAWDDLNDPTQNSSNLTRSVGYQWGSAQNTQFTYNWNNSLDRVGESQNQTQTFGMTQVLGRVVTLSATHALQDNSAASGSQDSTSDQVKMTFDPKALFETALDVDTQFSHDGDGGFDNQVAMNMNRTMGHGLSLGFQAGTQETLADSAATVDTVHTLGFSGTKQFDNIASISTNWLSTASSDAPPGQPASVNATTTVALTPNKNLALQDQYTTNDGNDNQAVNASYALPTSPKLGATKVAAALTTQTGDAQPATQTSKVALDTAMPKAGALVHLLSLTSVHVEQNHSQTAAYSGASSAGNDTQLVTVAGGLALLKEAKWSYTYGTQNSSATADLPDARKFNLTLPIRKFTLAYEDSDQVVQSTGLFLNTKEHHLTLGAPVFHSGLTTSADLDQCIDYSSGLTQRTSIGWNLTGATASNQSFQLGITQQVESELNNGADHSMIYKVQYSLSPTPSDKLSLSCDTTTNLYQDRPGSQNATDATVSASFSKAY